MTARRTRRSWIRRILLPIVGAFAAILAMAGTAFAYWGATGSGTGTATTGTLARATAVSGVQTPGTGKVTVSWTAPTGSPSASAYYVLRSDGSNVVAACASSAANPVTGTSCVDSGVPLGAYTYTVVAVYRTWTSTSVPSAEVDVVAAPQTVTITSTPTTPTVGGSYTVVASGGGSGNAITFTGTAGICTVGAPTTATSATVSFLGAGSCVLTATQAGSTYYQSGSATQTFTVAPATTLNGAGLCFVRTGETTCSPTTLKIGRANPNQQITGWFTGVVRLLDSHGNPVAANVAATVSLTVSNANHLGNPSPTTVTIPAGSSDSGSFTINFTDNGSQDSGTLTASTGTLSVSIGLTAQ